jgi:hypothetical protein
MVMMKMKSMMEELKLVVIYSVTLKVLQVP